MYIQGQLFIKKRPKTVDQNFVNKYKMTTYLMNGEAGDIEVGAKDYSGLSSIFQLIVDNDNYYLREREVHGKYSTKQITVEELESDYMDFAEFLLESKYVGKVGYKNEPLINGEKSFCTSKTFGGTQIILYEHPSRKLIVKVDGEGNAIRKFLGEESLKLSIANERYNGDWTYEGEQLHIYEEPKDLYRQLYNEGIESLKKDNEQGGRKK